MYPNPYESPDLNLPPKGFSSRVSVYRGVANQLIPTGAWTKVQYNTRLWDTLQEFDITAPNYTFTPSYAGYYLIIAQLCWAAGGAFQRGIRFWDGTWRLWMEKTATAGQFFIDNAIAILYLTSSTVLQVQAWQNTGVGLNLIQGFPYTFLHIHRLS